MDLRAVADRARRVSLMNQGAAEEAALARPMAANVKKNRTRKNGIGEKDKQKCKKQVGQCVDFLRPRCENDPACLEVAQRCCPLAGNCDLNGFLTCIGV